MAKVGRPKKVIPDDLLSELEESISQSKPIEEVVTKSIKVLDNDIKDSKKDSKDNSEDKTLIEPELKKFEKQLSEIDTALDSVNPMAVLDMEERLKLVDLKIRIMGKKPILLAALDSLRTKDKLKVEQIKGNKDISPLEDGSLD